MMEMIDLPVEMPKKVFDQFDDLFKSERFIRDAMAKLSSLDQDSKYIDLTLFLYKSNNPDERAKMDKLFSFLWAVYDPDNPEETILSVTDVVGQERWYIQDKDKSGRNYLLSIIDDGKNFYYYPYGHSAVYFDSEEDARNWKLPIQKVIKMIVRSGDHNINEYNIERY